MLEIALALSYVEYDDIKGCDTTHKMWEALSNIYGGDDNLKRAKRESLRGKFDDMNMEEGENVVQYVARVKEIVSVIRSLGGQLQEEIVSRKYLRDLIPIYAIRVSTIKELRCVPRNTLTFKGINERLTAFELSNFDNYKPVKFESTFKAKMIVRDTKEVQTNKNNGKGKHVSTDSSTDEDDVDQLEALLARIFHRGRGKFRGKFPIICFNCNEVGHIAARYRQRRITRMEINSRTREKILTKITMTKVIDATLLKKTLMKMMMK